MNRYQERKQPYVVFAFVLIVFLVAAFFLGGLYGIPGSTREFGEGITTDQILYIARHPVVCYNEKIPAFLGIAIIAWFFVVSYAMYYYRNFSAYEHGSANWLDAAEACRELADQDEKYNRILSRNVKVSLRGGLSNNNMLVVGSSGSFKTTSLLHQNILQFSSCYVVLDVKGDTQYKFGNAILDAGYTIRSLNFKQPEISDRYNPFVYIEREDDLLRIIKALHDACRPQKEMSAADPFWDDAVDLYLTALFYYEWLENREKGKVGTMNGVMHLCTCEAQIVGVDENDNAITALQSMMDEKAEQYGAEYPPVNAYRKLKEGAPVTVGSVILMINGMLKICETAEVKRIFSDNEINIRELGTGIGGDPNKKMVLFLVIPDNNNVYNWIISMFYTQMFDILIRVSDDEIHAPLPVPVEVWMDEFYAGAKPADADVLLGVVRSRNISMIPMLQSISQIKTLYKNDKWETIMDNMATVVYLGSGPLATSTHKYISEELGKTTIDSRDDNVHLGNNGNSGLNFKRAAKDLMTPDEVKRMPSTECIIFFESRQPVYDEKAIPFDLPVRHYTADAFLKKRYAEAQAKGGYHHPVYTLYDPVHFAYITIDKDKGFEVIEDERDQRTYMEAAERDPNICLFNVEEKDLLYLSWGQPSRSKEEIEALFKHTLEKEQKRIEDIKGLAVMQEVEGMDVPNFGTNQSVDKSGWDKDDSLSGLLAKHWDDLTQPEQEQICLALDNGLSEDQVKSLMLLPLEDMDVRRRAFVLENRNM